MIYDQPRDLGGIDKYYIFKIFQSHFFAKWRRASQPETETIFEPKLWKL